MNKGPRAARRLVNISLVPGARTAHARYPHYDRKLNWLITVQSSFEACHVPRSKE
jgi:hypothetical protein